MSTHPGVVCDVPVLASRRAFSFLPRLGIVVVLLAGVLALLPVLYRAASGWTSDPLRSIGVLVPIAGIVFLIRGVREFPGPWSGTRHGLWLVVAACSTVLLHEYFAFHLSVTPKVQLDLLPDGLSISLLVSGALVLFGGWGLLRACLFPVVLVGITNPIPHAFNAYLDLPLQVASASAARSFAHLIHEAPTGQQLQLMFTPNFGMFIAPGCNGIRGALTLGFLALFAAVWRRSRPGQVTLYFAAGIAVGYLFNFLRLFVLVLYYKLGQSWPVITPWGTQVDYAIGGILFLLASFGLGSVVFQSQSATTGNRTTAFTPGGAPSLAWKSVSLFCLLCMVPAALNLRTLWRETQRIRGTQTITTDSLPVQNGRYHRVTEWNDVSEEGIRMYHWGKYSDGNPADDIDLGAWLPPSDHDVRYSHALRGEFLEPLSSMEHVVPGMGTITYSTYRYTEPGGQQVLLAALGCPGCSERIIGVAHSLGPIHVVSTDPTNYFRAYPARSAVLVHKASANSPADRLRRPMQQFLDGLDERSIFQAPNNLP